MQFSDAPVAKSGPDGDGASQLPTAAALYAEAPLGAVIGKIGGSTAGRKDGDVFAVGSFAVCSTTKNGPLFLTMNIDPTRVPEAAGTVTVTISEMVP